MTRVTTHKKCRKTSQMQHCETGSSYLKWVSYALIFRKNTTPPPLSDVRFRLRIRSSFAPERPTNQPSTGQLLRRSTDGDSQGSLSLRSCSIRSSHGEGVSSSRGPRIPRTTAATTARAAATSSKRAHRRNKEQDTKKRLPSAPPGWDSEEQKASRRHNAQPYPRL